MIGYLEFEGVGNGPSYDWYNGFHALTMLNAKNTGNVTGNSYVGGLMGCAKTDSSVSEIMFFTQTGIVTGNENTDNLIGQITNLILTES